jgi:acetyl-CoA acetyltransferase
MTPFGRYYDQGIKQLVSRVLERLFADSPVPKGDIQGAWFSNSGWGMSGGQHCIRGQVALAPCGLGGIPIVNVENACASGSTAFYGACLGIQSGAYDVALAIGAEKTAVPPDAPKEVKKQSFESFLSGTDVEVMRAYAESVRREAEKKRAETSTQNGGSNGAKKDRSIFMDFYSMAARAHIEVYGTTQEQLAVIAAKNHGHGALNPDAQYRFRLTPEEVINDVVVSYPLTRAMCAPMGDGAAAAILVSEDMLRKLGNIQAVRVRATVLGSTELATLGSKRAAALARECYEAAGVPPDDIDFAEVHDATAFGELIQTENLGFCGEGEGGPFAASGATTLGGELPVNPSGGLESRGHPIGATGLAMVAECVQQLRGQAGGRQVEGARLAMIENGGGFLGQGEAAIVMNILEAPPR